MRSLRQIRKILKEESSRKGRTQNNQTNESSHKGDIACLSTKSAIYYALHHDVNPEKLFSDIQKESDRTIDDLVDSDTWVDLDESIRVMDACCYNLGISDEEERRKKYREFGSSVLELRCLDPSLFYLPFIIGGPEDVVDVTILFAKHFENYIRRGIKKEENEIVITSRYKEGLEDITRCEWEEGLYEMIPTFYGCKPFEVEQTRCTHRGDSFCEYRINRNLEKDENATLGKKLNGKISNITPTIFKYIRDALLKYNEGLVDSLQEIQDALDDSERKSEIFRTYTRRSLVERVDKGEDPREDYTRKKEIDILFSDIRDFTSLSKDIELDMMSEFLNEYFRYMNSPIIANNGEIDKLIGDSIMAGFNDSTEKNSSDNAVKAAIDMRRNLAEYNKLGRFFDFPINNGVGVNHGEVIVGNMGSPDKLDNTLMGSPVNVASRLESLTKHYRLGILISESVKERLKDTYFSRFIDEAQVKGYEGTPIKIYEIYDQEPDDVKEVKLRLEPRYREAFEEYQNQEFGNAKNIYEELKEKVGPHNWIDGLPKDPLLDFYIARAEEMRIRKERGITNEWEGTYSFSEK